MIKTPHVLSKLILYCTKPSTGNLKTSLEKQIRKSQQSIQACLHCYISYFINMYTYVLKSRIYYSKLHVRWGLCTQIIRRSCNGSWPGQKEQQIPQPELLALMGVWGSTLKGQTLAHWDMWLWHVFPSSPFPLLSQPPGLFPYLATEFLVGCNSVGRMAPYPGQTEMTVSFKQERHHHMHKAFQRCGVAFLWEQGSG